MIAFPDPRTPPNKMDCLVKGPDCARHGFITTCIIAQNGTPPEQQVRSYLLSLRQATEQNVWPRDRNFDLTEAEFRELWQKLEQWEAAGGTVTFPFKADCADHPQRRM